MNNAVWLPFDAEVNEETITATPAAVDFTSARGKEICISNAVPIFFAGAAFPIGMWGPFRVPSDVTATSIECASVSGTQAFTWWINRGG